MNNNTNENNDFPTTGTPAHNNTTPRSVDSTSLAERYPPYRPDPACMECGGEGMIWHQVTRYSRDGEPDSMDYENEPCSCIFQPMSAEADKKCRACHGTGEVEETHIVDSEKITTFYACICLRFIPVQEPNKGETNE